MSLSISNDTTVFRAVSYGCKHKNILYDPKNSLIDHILYLNNHNYFILNDNVTSIADNVTNIPHHYTMIHNYHLMLSHHIEKHLDGNISHSMHLPVVFILENIKDYKKEDKHLIQQRLNNHTKIFLNETTYNIFQSKNSILLNPGIPLSVFKSYKNYETRSTIAILNCGQPSNNLQAALKQSGYESKIIDIHQPVNQLVSDLNDYKICIDISDNYRINLMCAAACGCQAITFGSQNSIDNMIYGCKQDNLLSTINTLQKNSSNIEYKQQYLIENYPIDNFIDELNKTITQISHEAYIL